MSLTLPVVTIAAFLDSINPCAISVLLLTIGFLFSLEKSRKQILSVVFLYVLGIFITYVLIGLGVLHTLSLFNIPRALSKFGALILISTSVISLLERFIPNFPIKLAIPATTKPILARLMQQGTLPAIFFLGVLVGLFEFPCTGGPYLLILSLLHDKATFSQGTFYLLYYNFIFVLPLIIIAVLASEPHLMAKVQSWRKTNTAKFDIISSLAMLILGLIIFVL